MGSVIDIRNLTKYYGRSKGIENLNLRIEQGEIFGFIGPNGAGKSTTIRCLLALIYPTSGSASIFGRDAIKCAPEMMRLSPFAQFDGKSLLAQGLPPAPTIAWLLIAAAMVALSFRLHAARDLHT